MNSSSDFTTFFDVLRHRAEHEAHKTAYVFLDDDSKASKITYSELDQQARRIAAEIQRHTQPGDRVLLIFTPGLEFLSAFFGCIYAGVIAVPLSPPESIFNQEFFSKLKVTLEDVNPALLLTISSMSVFLKTITTLSNNLKRLACVSIDKLKPDAHREWHMPTRSAEDIAFIQYTSGSTSKPKGIMVTHANLIHNSRSIANVFGITSESTVVSWLPTFHDMGLIGVVLQAMYTGTPAVLMSPLTFLKQPVFWLKTISQFPNVASPFPNFALELCLKRVTEDELKQLNLGQWKVACNGAEQVRSTSLSRFTERFAISGFQSTAHCPVYGLAEATLLVSGKRTPKDPVRFLNVSRSKLAENKIKLLDQIIDDSIELVSCGQSLPDQKILIVQPETHNTCAENEVGEIWISGPSVTQGYWGKPETTREIFQAYTSDTLEGPYLRTGDLGFLNQDELFVTGRMKDLIIIRGKNYYPEDIERSVESIDPRVRKGCVAAFSIDSPQGESLALALEVKPGTTQELDALLQNIRDTILTKHGIAPHAVLAIKKGSIPKTTSGKIRRHRCKQHWLENAFKIVRS